MTSRWKGWLKRWVGAAVPMDGDPGRWAPRSRSHNGRLARSGRLEATGRGETATLSVELRAPVGRELQLPPPAA
jgi:hypothetical protein